MEATLNKEQSVKEGSVASPRNEIRVLVSVVDGQLKLRPESVNAEPGDTVTWYCDDSTRLEIDFPVGATPFPWDFYAGIPPIPGQVLSNATGNYPYTAYISPEQSAGGTVVIGGSNK